MGVHRTILESCVYILGTHAFLSKNLKLHACADSDYPDLAV